MFKAFLLIPLVFLYYHAGAQRTYTNTSVLATGDWYKISTGQEGIYKIDAPLLARLGINTNNLPSSSIRLFGNGNSMLPEACGPDPVPDDLRENAVKIFDGGDGYFSGSDYFLFYAKGADEWIADSVHRQFYHRKNLYTQHSFYFITIGGIGKRVADLPVITQPSTEVSTFDEHFFYEAENNNLLSSGQQWYGEHFGNEAGMRAKEVFRLPFENMDNGSAWTIRSKVIARSIGSDSRFAVQQNNRDILLHQLQAVGAGNTEVFARESTISSAFFANGGELTYSFQSSAFGAEGWLDWFEVFGRSPLVFSKDRQLLFRDWNSVKTGAATSFVIANAGNQVQVWDITNPSSPLAAAIHYQGNTARFNNDCSTLHEYIAFANDFLVPELIGRVRNQNLHAGVFYNMIIIAPASLVPQANRLADYHRQKDHLSVLVAETGQVFNEFASGAPDPAAIRNFIKMFYDRAANDSTKAPKYLLLFGDASYDPLNRVKNNNNLVPSFQSRESLDPLATYVSDDFFGFLDDWEDINSGNLNLLDIGIGRIPAATLKEATRYIDKIINYHQPASMRDWRNEITFIADDEDYNMHLQDAEEISDAVSSVNPRFHINKIYLDAYKQETTATGSSYPTVKNALKERVESGTLILNYTGHGGWRRLAEETILDQQFVSTWENKYQLPLFVTATCDFAPYDNPLNYSLGEEMLMRENTGVIALMTTTRLVFAFSNRILNRNYMETALAQKPDGSYRSLGEAMKTAKNLTYSGFNDPGNNRKFTLLGDPALTLAFPVATAALTQINGVAISGFADTLKASGKYVIKGEVQDETGLRMNSFNGNVYVTLFDKPETDTTKGNDPSSIKRDFSQQSAVLFKGKAMVANGVFATTVIIPKDINNKPGKGSLNLYAENGMQDGNGRRDGLAIGGSMPASDLQGPEIGGWLDDFNFKNGGTVSERPLLLLALHDSSGINIATDKPGHRITAVLDNDQARLIELNRFFLPSGNKDTTGSIQYRMPLMNEGMHHLKVKAWDGANNYSEKELNFRVIRAKQLIGDMFNYPNPVNRQTSFCFTHNWPAGEPLEVFINIYTVSGALVKSIYKTINANGYRSCDMEWDGLDAGGSRLKSGTYIWQLHLQTPDGREAIKSKMLLLM